MAENEQVISSSSPDKEDDTSGEGEKNKPQENTEPDAAQEEEPEEEYSIEERKKIGGEVEKKYTGWREPRRTYELQWFITAAYIDGKHTSETIQSLSTIQDLSKTERRKKNIANKLWAKHRARFAKFAKTRPKPIVVPFTTERQARLDARATEHALEYTYERTGQEQKYVDVLQWAARTGKAYWFLNWNPDKLVTIKTKNDVTHTSTLHDVPEGDVEIEVGSGFDILVPEVRQFHLGKQSEVMHVQVKDIKAMRKKYEEYAEFINPDSRMTSPFEFERQISYISGSEAGALASMSTDTKGPQDGVITKTIYTAPNGEFPKGRMIIVMNGFAVKIQNELPFGFHDMENPYPIVEFADMPGIGRFYCGTFVEQLIPLQRGYNMLRDKLEAHIRMGVHPKTIVARQARVAKGAFTNEATEIIEWNFIPGMPEPHHLQAANVAPDAWRFAQLITKEFDDISQVQPSVEGKTGAAKSGLQTSLLQEASDSVHSPDARGFELSVMDASYKMRRIMKLMYTVPRLLSYSGRSAIPEVYEFSEKNIDEHASIVVQIGSGLAKYKSTQIQQFMELYKEGLLGEPNDPELKRRVLGMLDIGGLEKFQEEARQDEDMARMENIDILDGREIPIPQFYEDHMAHYATHTDELKNPANRDIDEKIKRALIGHTLLHMFWINPSTAWNLANKLNFKELIDAKLITPPQQPTPQPGGPTPPPQAGGQAQPVNRGVSPAPRIA